MFTNTGPATYALALLSRGDGPHVLGAQWDSYEALQRGAAGASAPVAAASMVQQILSRAAAVIPDVLSEFGKIGGSGGCRWIYFTDPNVPRPRFGVGDAVDALHGSGASRSHVATRQVPRL